MPLISKKTGDQKRNGAKCEYSKASLILFSRILGFISDPGNAFFATHGEEFKLENKFYDFKYHNCLIEYRGNYFHADPRVYSPISKIRERKASEIWAKDKEKEEIAEKNGFKLLVVWEDSYSKEPEHVLKMCVNFLLDNMSKNGMLQ